ncbi:MAG: transporter substrate-binding protein [Chitinophagaceae bacterium]|nr:transporter substrate-binding protein [Chitinophagaceae bacterium]
MTRLRQEEFTFLPAIDFLRENTNVKTLLCLFNGKEAEQFYREFAPLQRDLNLDIYVSPMMLLDSFPESLGKEFRIAHVKGYLPWHASFSHPENQIFKETIAASGHTANLFYLLGWETGILFREIIRLRETGLASASAIVNLLKTITFESPRGWLKIDPRTHYSYGPSYLATWNDDMRIKIINEVGSVEAEWNAFTEVKMEMPEYSGWRNTYLCI